EQGVASVVCEEKHMGSRAGVVVCRSPQVAVDRFGLPGPRRGVIYTRTGRPFFSHGPLEQEILERLAAVLEKAGLWDELATDWLCLDCELMPWSLKAKGLLQSQYAAVGAAGEAYTHAAVDFLSHAAEASHLDEESRNGIAALLSISQEKRKALGDYREAYRHYCWEVLNVEDVRLAPFHFLAAEGATFTQHDHLWHMAMAGRLAATEPNLFPATRWREVRLDDEAEVAAAVRWWEELTAVGGEGMVVKPRDFIVRSEKGIVQPAVKCRGREYLRIIYGPEYDRPENLSRLRQRSLRHKQSMADREFALGLEGLERFIARRPLREVHQCVLAVLAMESEPVDPRL
ncbi:MAG: polynucleotide kinasephosphatase, partial [Akkermansiaceae bacterium]|nr:polynucleotide kinasephosphatase [Akkermansiaceae bacterium]